MQKSNRNVITRRAFLNQSCKSGLAVALGTLVDIPFVMKRALALGLDGKKKLLFIWLRGANDALNSVIPVRDDAYASSRPTLGIPGEADSVYATGGACFDATVYKDIGGTARLSTDPTYAYANAIALGNRFAALHPSLKFLGPVYNAGDLALVHRVAYPRQSRSHFDSQRYWENGNPNNNLVNDGIFYRTVLESGLAHTSPLTGVSIQSSLPLILRGSEAAMTNLPDPGNYRLYGVPYDPNNPAVGTTKATNYLAAANSYPFPSKLNRELLQLQYSNLEQTLGVFANIDFSEGGNTFRDDIKTDADVDWYPSWQQSSNDADGYFLFPTEDRKNGGWRRPDGSNVFNKYVANPAQEDFFAKLKATALVLNQTGAFIAGTELGGFDTHKGQGGVTGTHPNLNRAIGWALYALRKYFTRYGKGGAKADPNAQVSWDDVVVVTLSEFGRTTVENADLGTDHAEAGLMFVAGGSVKGYQAGLRSGVYGCNPSEFSGAKSNLNWVEGLSGSMFGVSGRYLKRIIDYRSLLGEVISKHLGASDTQVRNIIPGYATANEPELKSGGSSRLDGTPILGEVGIL